MERTGPVPGNGQQVVPGAVPFVPAEPVLREGVIICLHDLITGNLGEDGSSGDGEAKTIARRDDTMRDGAAGGLIAVDQDKIRRRIKSIDGLPHGQECRAKDIDRIDDLLLDHAEPEGQGVCPDGLVESFPPACAEPLGIIDPDDDTGCRKDDGGGNHRAGEAPAPGFIDSGDIAVPRGTKTRFLSGSHRRTSPYVSLRSVMRAAFPFSFRR